MGSNQNSIIHELNINSKQQIPIMQRSNQQSHQKTLINVNRKNEGINRFPNIHAYDPSVTFHGPNLPAHKIYRKPENHSATRE